MIKHVLAATAALALLVPAAANAELAQGTAAPDFTTMGALAGKQMKVNLKELLKKGPVVLYFYPKAFTSGCTMEAHAFAEATADFAKAGATVLGMSNDDLPTLQKFSTAECRDKFAVATATKDVIKAYDVSLKVAGISSGLTKRTSYVISKTGKIVLVHSDMDYKDHVKLTLEAVQKLKKG
ncbi:peroxiredoxin [Novosphingobium sediminis]|uniref:thioredoxin-dependent peroxiredoxin n=1 Tax=Novosphingobium sediminis TaxID=707214 RepID=A0A512AGQ0_9SPHN|nr:peroxiredoxin [Novosphingobium sediminis]GEN98863.1 peroxiredoxin [Novosphingobium sediminis]